MAPAGQGLETDGSARGRVHHWLVVDFDGLGAEALLELFPDVEGHGGPGAHRRAEGPPASLARLLGRVHGQVGISHQLLDVSGVVPPGDHGSDPDAGPHPQLPAGDHEGLVEQADDVGRQVFRVDHRPGLVEEDRELVAADPGHGVGGPEAGGQAVGHAAEQHVARGVTQGVVDRLEVVEVDEGDGQAGAVSTMATVGLAHPVGEQRPVGQPREGVVQAPVLELALELTLVGDVAELAEDQAHPVGVLDDRHGQLPHAHRPVLAGDPLVGREAGPLTADHRDHRVLLLDQLLGVGEGLVGVGQQFGLGQPDQGTEGRVDLHEAPVEGAQGHPDRVVGEGVIEHPFG